MDIPKVGELHIDVTGTCNLKCGYCYFFEDEGSTKGPGDPSFEALRELILEAEALGAGEITFTGGEPLLRDDIVDLCKVGESWKTVLTNGLLLTPELVHGFDRVERLKEIKVSLDGFEGHDRVRGEGTSKIIRENVRYMDRESEIPYVINTMLSKHNVDDLLDLYEWILDSSCYRWAIDVPTPAGRASGNDMVRYDARLFDTIERLVRRFLDDGMPFKLHVMNVFHSGLVEEEPGEEFSWSSASAHPCAYYLGGLTVRIDRSIAFCPSLPLVFGHLDQGEGLGGVTSGEAFRRWASLRVADVEHCATCRYRSICGGGCRADAVRLTGRIDAVDESACVRMGFFEERILPMLPPQARARLTAKLDPDGTIPPAARRG